MEIEIDDRKHIGYKIDHEIINGLYQTFELEKIIDNCKNFEIQVKSPENVMFNSKMTRINNRCILTMIFDAENQVQFLVGNDMSLVELNSIPFELLPIIFRETITKAYKLI
jgi:hypothetical protein